ncbi:hypothetical protein [Xylanibacter caecicola]|uniref:hypothetical protein n=1 Tax=Xylanibacter caecicola TaxID=2736294 RepID=UPI00258788E6|nr:hypothetical protein [Xylanibacter caecicola]
MKIEDCLRSTVKNTSLFILAMNPHQVLLGPQEMISTEEIDELDLTEEQKKAIKKALTDYRFILSRTYRDKVYRLCCLLHEEDKEVVSYDTIGKLFKIKRTHGAIIDEFRKSLKDPKEPHRPYFLDDEKIL